MADQKITEFTELTAVASTDMLAVVDDPDGSPETKKAAAESVVSGGLSEFILQNLIKNNPGQIVTDGNEPQWWDDSVTV